MRKQSKNPVMDPKDTNTAKTNFDEWAKEIELRNKMDKAEFNEWLNDGDNREFLRHMPRAYANDPEMAAQHRKDMAKYGIVVDKDPFPPKNRRTSK